MTLSSNNVNVLIQSNLRKAIRERERAVAVAVETETTTATVHKKAAAVYTSVTTWLARHIQAYTHT